MAHADMRMTLGHTRQPEAGLQTELSAQVAIGIRLSKGATSNRSRVGVRSKCRRRDAVVPAVLLPPSPALQAPLVAAVGCWSRLSTSHRRTPHRRTPQATTESPQLPHTATQPHRPCANGRRPPCSGRPPSCARHARTPGARAFAAHGTPRPSHPWAPAECSSAHAVSLSCCGAAHPAGLRAHARTRLHAPAGADADGAPLCIRRSPQLMGALCMQATDPWLKVAQLMSTGPSVKTILQLCLAATSLRAVLLAHAKTASLGTPRSISNFLSGMKPILVMSTVSSSYEILRFFSASSAADLAAASSFLRAISSLTLSSSCALCWSADGAAASAASDAALAAWRASRSAADSARSRASSSAALASSAAIFASSSFLLSAPASTSYAASFFISDSNFFKISISPGSIGFIGNSRWALSRTSTNCSSVSRFGSNGWMQKAHTNCVSMRFLKPRSLSSTPFGMIDCFDLACCAMRCLNWSAVSDLPRGKTRLGQALATSRRLVNSASPSWSLFGRMITFGSVFALIATMRLITSVLVSGGVCGTINASVAVRCASHRRMNTSGISSFVLGRMSRKQSACAFLRDCVSISPSNLLGSSRLPLPARRAVRSLYSATLFSSLISSDGAKLWPSVRFWMPIESTSRPAGKSAPYSYLNESSLAAILFSVGGGRATPTASDNAAEERLLGRRREERLGLPASSQCVSFWHGMNVRAA
mmetsp:Transcript_75267/g.207647  ORF Transcript_75267/g.207647 Transcript_75267/m.207647 type:complete len:707 (-) Transcript_75267:58-2178(-)